MSKKVTRSQLEEKAAELGVTFTKTTTDAALASLIEEAEIAKTITVLDRNIPEN